MEVPIIEEIWSLMKNSDFDGAIRLIDETIRIKGDSLPFYELQVLYESRSIANFRKVDTLATFRDHKKAYNYMVKSGKFFRYPLSVDVHEMIIDGLYSDFRLAPKQILQYYRIAKDNAKEAADQTAYQEKIDKYEVLVRDEEELEAPDQPVKPQQDGQGLTKNQKKKLKKKKSKQHQKVDEESSQTEMEEDGGVDSLPPSQMERDSGPSTEEGGPNTKEGGPNISLKELFDITYSFDMDVVNDELLKGEMYNSEANACLPCSLLLVSRASLESNVEMEQFRRLCNSHTGLLTFFHVLQAPKEKVGSIRLVTEPVNAVSSFFKLEMENYRAKNEFTREGWWYHIAEKFRVFFRDVIRTLRFLYIVKKHPPFGNLFDVYVTNEGRARILPSTDPHSENRDETVLLSHMTAVIFLGCDTCRLEEADYLPDDLRRFFRFIETGIGLPVEYLIDYPYFWSIDEKVVYPSNLKIVLSREGCLGRFKNLLRSLDNYQCWFANLNGVYLKIYEKADRANNELTEEEKEKIKAAGGILIYPYKKSGDIFRFIMAVYHHANDDEYEGIRGKVNLSGEDIEKYLSCLFPMFYENMYECIGRCFLLNDLSICSLREIGSCYTKAHAFPESQLCH